MHKRGGPLRPGRPEAVEGETRPGRPEAVEGEGAVAEHELELELRPGEQRLEEHLRAVVVDRVRRSVEARLPKPREGVTAHRQAELPVERERERE